MRVQAIAVRSSRNEVLYHRTYREGIDSMWMGPCLEDLVAAGCLRDREVHYSIFDGFGIVAKMLVESGNIFDDSGLEIRHYLDNLANILKAFVTAGMELTRLRRNVFVVMELAIDPQGYILMDMTTNFMASIVPGEVVDSSVAFCRPLDLVNLVKDKIIKPASGLKTQVRSFEVSPLGSGSGSGLGGGGLLNNGSDIWWRRYVPVDHYPQVSVLTLDVTGWFQNEVLIDLVETLSCRINMRGLLVRSWLTGKVEVVAKLNGLPECEVALEGVEKVVFERFHYCVKRPPVTEKWDGRVRFVPEDGSKFKLLDFCLNTLGSKWRPPIGFKASWTMDENGVFRALIVMTVLGGNDLGFVNRLPVKAGTGNVQQWVLENTRLRIPMYPGDVSVVPRIESSCTLGSSFVERNVLVWDLGRVEYSMMTQKLEIVARWHPRDVVPNKRLRGLLSFECTKRNLSGVHIPHVDIRLSHGDRSSIFKGCRSMVRSGTILFEF